MALLNSDFAFARFRTITELSVLACIILFYGYFLVSVEMLLNFPFKIWLLLRNPTARSLLFCFLVLLVLCIIIIVAMYLFCAGWPVSRHFVCLLWAVRG